MTDTTASATTLSALTDEILESHFDANPDHARDCGLRAWDGRLPDRSEAGLTRRIGELDRFESRLAGLDATGLSKEEAFDLRLLRHQGAAERFRIADRRIWHRDPIVYLEQMGLLGYLERDYAPRRDRAAGACLHLEGIPRLLDEARSNLEGPFDPTLLDTAMRLYRSWADFVDGDLGEALDGADEGDDDLRRALVQARCEASRAARELADHLEEERRTARPGAYAIGPELLGGMIRVEEGVDIPLGRLLEVGREDLERNRDRLREVAARIDPRADAADVMRRIKANHPAPEEILDVTRRLLGTLRAFLVERDLVSIPSDVECRVLPTPPYLSWAFAMMDGPPALAPEEYPGIYYVTPPGADWDAQRTEEWLTEFSRAGLTNTSVHEAWPGHFLHALHIRRNPSRLVRMSGTYSSAEAWAHYSEQLMVEERFGGDDSELEMAQLGDALLRNVRLVVAIGLHTGDLNVEEATWMFRKDALLADEAARTEAERGTFDPGYLNYTLGKLMLLKLREDVRGARGPDFSLRSFHDDFLYWGMAPVPFVRAALLGEAAGSALEAPGAGCVKSGGVSADVVDRGGDMARILIIEDMRFISQILMGFFAERGHTVEVAADGVQALETARETLPDLILSDIAMPGIDGLEVAKRLKEDEATASIPIMMVTSRSDQESMATAQRVGVDEYILKPFDAGRLMKKAGELLGGFPMNYSLELRGNVPVASSLMPELGKEAVPHLSDVLAVARDVGGDVVVLDLSSVKRVDVGSVEGVKTVLEDFWKKGMAVYLVPPASGIGVRSLAGQLEGRVAVNEDLGTALTALGADPNVPGRRVRLSRATGRVAVPPAG